MLKGVYPYLLPLAFPEVTSIKFLSVSFYFSKHLYIYIIYI